MSVFIPLSARTIRREFTCPSDEECSALMRAAPVVDGKKDWSAVEQWHRKALVFEATQKRERADYLKTIILDWIAAGAPLPPEYLEWLTLYLATTDASFIPKTTGRPGLDWVGRFERMVELNGALKTLRQMPVDEALRTAATTLPYSFETLRAVYYSDEYREMQDTGDFLTL